MEKEKKIKLPALDVEFQRVAFVGKVARYVVEAGSVEIEVINDGLDSTFPIDSIGTMIEELTALKGMLDNGSFEVKY